MGKVSGERIKMTLKAINMKGSINSTRKRVMAFSLGSLAMSIRVLISQMNVMVMVKCISLMELSIRENGQEESNVVKVK